MNIAGLPLKEYCKPTGIPIIIVVVVGLIGMFLAYDASSSVDSYLANQDMLYWFGMFDFAVLLIAGALAGYFISAKSNLHLAGAVAGAASLVVGTVIVRLAVFATVVPKLKDIAAGLAVAGVEGAESIQAFGATEMVMALALSVSFALVIGIVVGLIGQMIGNSKRR